MRNAIILLALLGLTACQTAASGPPATNSIPDQQVFSLARQAVISGLKDPDSAKLGPMVRRVHTDMFGTRTDLVCGTVNAKNSFGGYTGAKMFAYRIAQQDVIMDEGQGLMAVGGSIWCTT